MMAAGPGEAASATPGALAPQFLPRPLGARAEQHHRRPASDEIHLWRFQNHWLPVPLGEAQLWLDTEDWAVVRRQTQAAARRRVMLGRVTARWLARGLVGEKAEGSFVPLAATGLDFALPGSALHFGLSLAGPWILLMLYHDAQGWAAIQPSSHAPTDTLPGALPACRFVLPMPGSIALSLVTDTAPRRVRAFGWRAGERLTPLSEHD